MTSENKRKMRELIEKENWNKLGKIEENPSPLLWDKEVEILYEDMDGHPCKCNALLVHGDSFTSDYFRATNGAAEGNRMSGVFAYREII